MLGRRPWQRRHDAAAAQRAASAESAGTTLIAAAVSADGLGVVLRVLEVLEVRVGDHDVPPVGE
jgi:hypothetical protein